MQKFPDWFNIKFVLKHPYQIVPTDEGFQINLPKGHVVLNADGFLIHSEGVIPDEFAALSSRQAEIIEKDTPNKFLVIGCGGVGFWFVLTMLAVNSHAKFIVFDHDSLEESNFERLPYPASFLGMTKVESLKFFVRTIYQKQENIIIVNQKFFKEYFNALVLKPDVVVECSDSYPTQLETYKYCMENELPFYKIGTIENRVTIATSVPGENWSQDSSEQNDPGRCGQMISQWLPTQMTAAAELTSFLMRKEFIDINLFKTEVNIE